MINDTINTIIVKISKFIDLLSLMNLLLANGTIGHEPTAIIAKLIMIARSKIAILLIFPALPTCSQLA